MVRQWSVCSAGELRRDRDRPDGDRCGRRRTRLLVATPWERRRDSKPGIQAVFALEPLRPSHRAGSTAVGKVHAMTKMIEETKKGPRRTTAASGRTCAHVEDKYRCTTILS